MAYTFKRKPLATHCGYCGKELPEDRHWKQLYCCESHRVMAAQKRAKAKESSNG
jgi:predicted nucleic acid-binding Zn ribbon protein